MNIDPMEHISTRRQVSETESPGHHDTIQGAPVGEKYVNAPQRAIGSQSWPQDQNTQQAGVEIDSVEFHLVI